MELDFIREDWILFRNLDTLAQKSGVHKYKLGKLIAKELTDNALDAAGSCEINLLNNNGFYVKDYGPGINIEMLPELFSFNRPLISSKLLRLPTRGALGNGLRVVSGVVVATGGQLFVSTESKKYRMIMKNDGRTLADVVDDYDQPGTLIEVYLGNAIKPDLSWAQDAIKYSGGEKYKGKTSGYWYTSEAFFELLQSFNGYVWDLVVNFDGCTGTKASAIIEGFKGRIAKDLSFEEAEFLLNRVRNASKPVNSNRLGCIGQFDNYGYYKNDGQFILKSAKGKFDAEIPFIVEGWVDYKLNPEVNVLVNKTPITGDMHLSSKKTEINIWGCGIDEYIKIKPAHVVINIITPYMPIISDGKVPDLRYMAPSIANAVKKAGSQAKKYITKVEKDNYKINAAFLKNLNNAINKASGNGGYRFSQRQLYYVMRPYILAETGRELEYGYFCKDLLTDYEAENGDIELMYRDNRGTLYHPHLKQFLPVGTISVEHYSRPKWTFNKVLYIEKEGFFDILIDKKIPEKYDMALLTSKGYASRAVKDLLDSLSDDSNEEITVFCIHDADAAGTKIYESLQETTKSRPGRKIEIVNLGLEPKEAIEMGLEIEQLDKKDRKKATASYLSSEWQEWLQVNRVELNAMPTPLFLEWIENKLSTYDTGKVLPPEQVIGEALELDIQALVSDRVRDKLLKEHGFEDLVRGAIQKIQGNYQDQIVLIRNHIKDSLEEEATSFWSEILREVANDIVHSSTL